MSDESKKVPEVMPEKVPAGKVKNLETDERIKTLSAQAPVELHKIVESAQGALHLDKASVIRLAVRRLIRDAYQGKGQWDSTKVDINDILAASNVDYSAHGLPE